jgi:hypothetical protein
MFAVELKFESEARGVSDAKTDAINWLIRALVRNGSLLDWTVYGIEPAHDAFHRKSWNELVREKQLPGM